MVACSLSAKEVVALQFQRSAWNLAIFYKLTTVQQRLSTYMAGFGGVNAYNCPDVYSVSPYSTCILGLFSNNDKQGDRILRDIGHTRNGLIPMTVPSGREHANIQLSLPQTKTGLLSSLGSNLRLTNGEVA